MSHILAVWLKCLEICVEIGIKNYSKLLMIGALLKSIFNLYLHQRILGGLLNPIIWVCGWWSILMKIHSCHFRKGNRNVIIGQKYKNTICKIALLWFSNSTQTKVLQLQNCQNIVIKYIRFFQVFSIISRRNYLVHYFNLLNYDA